MVWSGAVTWSTSMVDLSSIAAGSFRRPSPVRTALSAVSWTFLPVNCAGGNSPVPGDFLGRAG